MSDEEKRITDEEKKIFSDIRELDDDQEQEVIDLAGYQVTKGELFSHVNEPSLTLWYNRIRFNMACLKRFPKVKHIQVMINPEQRRIVIRPCTPDTPDCLRWANGGGEAETKNRDMTCKIFAAKVFDLMGWSAEYRYKILGKPATCDGELLFLFRLNDFELFLGGKKKGSYLPKEWRDYFGVPVEKHNEEYKIDLADGYITTDKV
ncbi:MAG: integrase [Lachnospiraceae bacterium]|jgi:hypothetical protein|nr:integrase [Lachnospiraceae bacterium]